MTDAVCWMCDAPIGWTDGYGHTEVEIDGKTYYGGLCKPCLDGLILDWVRRNAGRLRPECKAPVDKGQEFWDERTRRRQKRTGQSIS